MHETCTRIESCHRVKRDDFYFHNKRAFTQRDIILQGDSQYSPLDSRSEFKGELSAKNNARKLLPFAHKSVEHYIVAVFNRKAV